MASGQGWANTGVSRSAEMKERTPARKVAPGGHPAVRRLTRAQAEALFAAVRLHPAAYDPGPRQAVARRLAAMRLLVGHDGHGGYQLTPLGLQSGAALAAQAVINRANALRQSKQKLGVDTPVEAALSTAEGAIGTLPPDWPFPTSGHAW